MHFDCSFLTCRFPCKLWRNTTSFRIQPSVRLSSTSCRAFMSYWSLNPLKMMLIWKEHVKSLNPCTSQKITRWILSSFLNVVINWDWVLCILRFWASTGFILCFWNASGSISVTLHPTVYLDNVARNVCTYVVHTICNAHGALQKWLWVLLMNILTRTHNQDT